MRNDVQDAVIIGSGACGSVIARELAAAGWRVTVLEAGRPFAPAEMLNRESNAGRIFWTEPRVYDGKDHVVPKTGASLGGGTHVWLGVMPRFHPEDFQTRSIDGVGEDWPIGYGDLRPHYQQLEHDFGLAGECGPFAPEQYSLPMPPHPMNWHAQLLAKGARKLGAQPFAPPIAVNSEPYDGRPACTYCGWCASGCVNGAKATANIFLQQAARYGARILSESFARAIECDEAGNKVTGVIYLDADLREHRIRSDTVILAAHAIETPRLLLMSANNRFPDGLANSSGLVGRYFMSHPTWQVFGTFDEPVNAYKGMQMGHVMVQDYYKRRPADDFARGYILLSYMMTPATYANLSGVFVGADFKEFLHDYARTAAWWAHAEGLPHEDNRITLDPDEKDSRDLPVARVTYSWTDNDVKLAGAARDRAREMMEASGARKVRTGLNYGAHAMGGCRMGYDPKTSVTNSFGQTHDIPNLFVADTSLFVTGAGVNPTLTAMALARRAADNLIARRIGNV